VGGLHDDELRSRCHQTILALSIPSPFGLEPFRECLERHRGRPVELILRAMPTGCSGLWLGDDGDADYILCERRTTPLHQLHIVSHETGHMLFGHRGSAVSTEFARLLFPGLNPEFVQAFLARSVYTEEEEQEAETFASLLLEYAARLPPASGLAPDQAALLGKLEGAFTIPWGRTYG
jgi:hypothetical protein